ncbi:ABC transporter substrate-binding protein [Paracoccus aerodenitrificans]|uniref:ABC transporter substrate-binding protein n=1 Tax=Paracoccus aerodenitrificans TaxID=3017781 RepID=UPI0022F13B52|nr:ABC transporter substrate-binding protein [Paracoccus aerodenitrificans]WBU65458.1 ABC transporter substrate-binding protein [Paracoccus aerodenitrificans]
MKSILGIAAASSLAIAASAGAGEVRMMWYSDGVEGEVMQDLLDRFMEENPDINVILDNVAYQVIMEQLPIQLAAGEGPDIARVTNLKEQAEHWLDLTPYVEDPEYWRSNFGDQFDWMRPDGTDIIPGFMTQLTLVGGFANKTLFEQAGVEMPGEGATWDEWVAAATEVQESQQLPAALVIDRSGHRITGPLLSSGAVLKGEDGKPAPLDAAAQDFITRLVGWTESGQHMRDVWVSAAGTTYRSGADEFINANIAMLYSGSWQVANLSTKIGDGFDWVAIGSPCGSAGCSGLPGGAALVANKNTSNPEDVGKVMDFLARQDIVKEFSERTLFLPAHKGVIEAGGLDFQTEDPQAKAALEKFVEATGALIPAANEIPAWRYANAMYGAMVNRISQAMAGEMPVEEIFPRIDSDIAEQVAAADGGQ